MTTSSGGSSSGGSSGNSAQEITDFVSAAAKAKTFVSGGINDQVSSQLHSLRRLLNTRMTVGQRGGINLSGLKQTDWVFPVAGDTLRMANLPDNSIMVRIENNSVSSAVTTHRVTYRTIL